jgi:hypothetical protein
MPGSHRQAIRNCGGIAEHLPQIAFVRLGHAAATSGCGGDASEDRVDERVGLRRTDHRARRVLSSSSP